MYGYILNRHVYTFLVQDMINAAYQKPDGAEPEPSIKMKRPLRAIHKWRFCSQTLTGNRQKTPRT